MGAASAAPSLLRRQKQPGFHVIKAALLVATIFALVAGAGGSWAYVTSHGTGTATTAAGAVNAVTLTPATPTSALYPGASADIALTVSNPNGAGVVIPSLALDTSRGTSGISVDGAHAGCDPSSVTFTAGGTGWTIPAHASAYQIDLPGAIAMTTSASDACQGASFTVYLKVGP